MAHDVFISHSQKDKMAADAACNVFERNGLRCWIAPRDVDGSKPWAEAIVDAIDNAKILVLVFSGSSNESKQVTREIDCAISRNIVVVPVRIEDVLPSHAMKYYLSTSHWVDAFPPPYEENFDRITERLQNLLGERREVKEEPENGKRSATTRNKYTVFTLIALTAVLSLGVSGYVLSRMPSAQLASSSTPAQTSLGCDTAANFPESEATKVSRFIYFDRDNRDQLREWERIKGDLWVERSYENAQTAKTLTTAAYFDVKGRSHVAFCDGSVVVREDDVALQLWIPDRTCENKSFRFRRTPSCTWIALPIIRDVK